MDYSDFLEMIKIDDGLVKSAEDEDGISVYSKHGNMRIVDIPNHVTCNMAFLCGIIVGDGHLEKFCDNGRKKYKISVEMTDLRILNMFQNRLADEFGLETRARMRKPRPNRKNSFIVSFERKVLSMLFNEVFEIPRGRKSETVGVPSVIMGDKTLQKSFVEGLFLADGGVNKNSIIFCSISKSLSDGVVSILNGMGIVCTTHKLLNKRFNRIFYESYIRGENMGRFKLLFPETAIKLAGVA